MNKLTWLALMATFLSGGCSGQAAQSSGEDNSTLGKGDAPTCDTYVDEWGAPVTITVRNDGIKPIYLQDTLNASVATAAGETVPAGFSSCSITCAGYQAGGGPCEDLRLDHPSVFRLGHGEAREFAWTAHTTSAEVLAVECMKDGWPTEDTPCKRVVPLPSAEYVLSVTAYTAVDCSFNDTSECTSCQEDAGGGCLIRVADGGGETIEATGILSYYPDQSDDLSLQPPFEVEIVFKD